MATAVRLAGSVWRQPAFVIKMRRVNGPPYKQSQRFNHIVEFTHVKLCILTKERSVSHSRRTGSSGPVAWQESEAESEKCRQERTFQVCCFTARLIFFFFFFFLGGRAIHYTYMDMQRKKPQVSNGRPSTASLLLGSSWCQCCQS